MATDADILALATPEIEHMESCAQIRTDGKIIAYPDPIRGWNLPTIGFGSTGPHVTRDTVWTMDECKADLAKRIPPMLAYFDAGIPWWRSLNAARAAVFVSMGYNMGEGFIHSWPHFLACCHAGLWTEAHDALLNPPKWLNQVKSRATTSARQILLGVPQ